MATEPLTASSSEQQLLASEAVAALLDQPFAEQVVTRWAKAAAELASARRAVRSDTSQHTTNRLACAVAVEQALRELLESVVPVTAEAVSDALIRRGVALELLDALREP
ncbi:MULTISPECIES: hypothetical protein [Kitasatospora]|uniref:Uncharacterized protein n=1 Tax=Kitasatospora setae (strain ATCC 33774 / DSM 43861 / JCM 3304 / KCC A-0304 / NBRC 14216 / KM-6054) TaxID=452652 RepID=E4NHM5_KITSK|nr:MULTISPECIES: hypothetical protein [Kitasatospora]BAJ31005.1 hypothetical protein KSE_52300 [Kitasatospora setae KM-6054]